MFLVAGSGGMLTRKQPPSSSSSSSSNTSTEDSHTHCLAGITRIHDDKLPTYDSHLDRSSSGGSSGGDADADVPGASSSCRARINEALSSLGSSSVALHHQGITSLMSPPPPTFHPSALLPMHSPGGCRSTQNARTRLMIIDSMLSSSAASDLPSTSAVRLEMYQETLDIQRSGFVDEVTCDMCWSIILKELYRGCTDGIVNVLARSPTEDIRAFFDELLARRPNWGLYIQPELQCCPSPSIKGKERARTEDAIRDEILQRCYAMLTDIMCSLRDELNYEQALTILRIHSRCLPLAVLFHHKPSRSRRTSLNYHLLLALLAHLDYSPTFSTDQPRLNADFQWVVTTAVELLCRHPTDDLRRVVSHILRALQPLAHADPLEPEITQLRTIFPWVQPWSPRKYLARHPVSPFLSFAIFLVDRSELAARWLLEGGLVRTMEALYDQDFPDPRVRDDDPYVQTRDELYKLCLRLLRSVSRRCDLRDCVLLEELKEDVRRSDRELSEQYFGVFWTD